MRKIIVSEFLSVDGMMSDPGDTMKWVTDNFSDKGGDYQSNLYGSIDTLLFGRTTYDLWCGYWPKVLSDPATSKRELDLAQKINRAKKVVVSHQPVTFSWENTVQLKELACEAKELACEAVLELKQQPGKDIAVSGSAAIMQQLTNLGLVDEYHLLVYPLIMGKGKPLFKDGERLFQLKLIGTEDFGNGVILLRYQNQS